MALGGVASHLVSTAARQSLRGSGGVSPPVHDGARRRPSVLQPRATQQQLQTAALLDTPEQVSRSRTEGLGIVTMIVQKDEGSMLGIDVGNVGGDYCGAVVLTMSGSGLVADWNSLNPTKQVCVGHVIIETNGVRGYWEMLDELRNPGKHNLQILRVPPNENWQGEISRLAKAFERDGASDVIGLRLPSCMRGDSNSSKCSSMQVRDFTCLPSVQACEVDVDQCAICLETLKPTARLVQLPCKHSFHNVCAARWLSQRDRHTCPLCVRPVFETDRGD